MMRPATRTETLSARLNTACMCARQEAWRSFSSAIAETRSFAGSLPDPALPVARPEAANSARPRSPRAAPRPHPCQWLVQKQQARLGSESRGKLQLALLAMSKHSGLTIRQMTDVQLVQRSRGVARGLALPPNRPPPTSVRLSPRDGRDRHVSMRGEGGEQLRHLIGADEPPSCALMHRHPTHIMSCKGDRAHVMIP